MLKLVVTSSALKLAGMSAVDISLPILLVASGGGPCGGGGPWGECGGRQDLEVVLVKSVSS